MSADTVSARPTPKAFISYSWDDEPHKHWVKAFGTRLRGDGGDVTLDRRHLHPVDQLPEFIVRSRLEPPHQLHHDAPTRNRRRKRRQGVPRRHDYGGGARNPPRDPRTGGRRRHREVEASERQKFEREREQVRMKREHERQVREAADRIKFD